MKRKISVSLEESLIQKLELQLTNREFRNRSHLIELALDCLINSGEHEVQKLEHLGKNDLERENKNGKTL